MLSPVDRGIFPKVEGCTVRRSFSLLKALLSIKSAPVEKWFPMDAGPRIGYLYFRDLPGEKQAGGKPAGNGGYRSPGGRELSRKGRCSGCCKLKQARADAQAFFR